jgi:hypothetical protein
MIRGTSEGRRKRLGAEVPDLHGVAIGLGALDYHAPAAPVSVTPVCGRARIG